jgi:hypothetical protein
MGPHRKLGIYIGYSSLSIIKYLEPLTGDLFTTRFADCILNEDHFPALGGESYQNKCPEIEWNAKGISFQDPRTIESEQQVQRTIDLQNIANNLPDAFTDYKGVTKSYHPARNVPERVEVLNKTTQPPINNKRGRSTPRSKMNLLISRKRQLNQIQIWLQDTWRILYILWIIIHKLAQLCA